MLVYEATNFLNGRCLRFGDTNAIQAVRIMALYGRAVKVFTNGNTTPDHQKKAVDNMQNWDEPQLEAFLRRRLNLPRGSNVLV
jgi:hypothetical protein